MLGVVRKARVLIVTPGNAILRNFFDQDAALKAAEVSYLTPAELDDDAKYLQPANNGSFDLVIFDRCAPGKEGAHAAGLTPSSSTACRRHGSAPTCRPWKIRRFATRPASIQSCRT